MKIINIPQNTDEWLEYRKGKISGSKLKDIVVKRGINEKVGFYKLLADQVEAVADEEDDRDRGHRLESSAIEAFEQAKGLEVDADCGIWVSDKNDKIIISPDGGIKIDGEYSAAVEAKCLNGPNHLAVVITGKLPDEFKDQRIQYFIVNEKLETLYFVFHNPNITVLKWQTFIIQIDREDVEDEIAFYEEYQTKTLEKIYQLLADNAF